MIGANIQKIKQQIGSLVKLIVVTKNRPLTDLQQTYDAGHKIFGENRVQEMVEKQSKLPADIEWHLIGHLQTNKVKYIAPFVYMIHSVDSLKLLETINKEALKNNRIINCLLQVYIAKEESKFGLTYDEIRELLDNVAITNLNNICICGLMGMATNTSDTAIVQAEFITLKNYFNQIKLQYFKNNNRFTELSMGMSGDYMLAVNCGSTMVRIGSLIFNNS